MQSAQVLAGYTLALTCYTRYGQKEILEEMQRQRVILLKVLRKVVLTKIRLAKYSIRSKICRVWL